MKDPAQNLSMSSGNMSKLNTGTLQKGINGLVLVNAINNSSNWILDKQAFANNEEKVHQGLHPFKFKCHCLDAEIYDKTTLQL